MRNRTPLYALALIGCWIAVLSLSNLACVCTGLRKQTPTPTRVVLAPTLKPTATRAVPTKTFTSVPTFTNTTEPKPSTADPAASATWTRVPAARTATATDTPEPLIVVDPDPEELQETFAALPPGTEFELSVGEAYVNSLVLEYLDDAPELPIDIMDLQVSFVPDQIVASAIVPLGFLRVEVEAKALWRAEACGFRAEILDVLIGGQTAPATLREQLDPLLKDALEASTRIPACFTDIDIQDGKLTIKGRKE